MSAPLLAITGATGAVGGMVAQHLANAQVPIRLLVRDPSRLTDLPTSEVFQCTYSDGNASRRALEGVSTLFMVSGAETRDRVSQHLAFVDAAAKAGVRHIVYTSFVGAAPDAIFTLARDHYVTEEHIARSGMSYTFLRDNLYLDFVPNMVGDDGVIRGPAGDGRAAAVARSDVARVAAAIVQEPSHHVNVTYELTGPQALSFAEMADIVSAQSGRTVRFHNETTPEAYESRAIWQAPRWQVDAWVSTYLAVASGVMARVSPDVESATGVAPLSLADLLASQPDE